ncbi:hypothetical protein DSECCO2_414800 [anaerobic digester metagenome]
MVEVVLQVKGVLCHLFLHSESFFLIDCALGLFNQAYDITHAKDSACDAVGIERLDVVHLLADTDVLDGFSNNRTQRQCGTAAGVTIELGENHPGNSDFLLKFLGDGNSVLTGHRVCNKERFIRLDGITNPLDLIHEGLVEVHAPACIDDQNVALLLLCLGKGCLCNLGRVFLPGKGEHRHTNRLTEDLQLQDGRRPDQVGGNQHGTPALPLEAGSQLCAGGGLAGSLQPHHQDDGGGVGTLEQEFLILLIPEQGDHVIVDDLHELLTRIDGLEDFLPKSFFHGPIDEASDNPQVYVSIQERHLDLFDGILDVLLGYFGLAGKRSHDAGELIAY